MCRRNQLLGCVLVSLGAGVLLGLLLNGGFLSFCFGVGTMILGFFVSKRK